MRRALGGRVWCGLAAAAMLAGPPGLVWSQEAAPVEAGSANPTTANGPGVQLGSIHGLVRSRQGAVYEGAQIRLTRTDADGAAARTATSDSAGQFSFGDVPAGTFSLTVSGAGFSPQTVSLRLAAGQALELAPMVLPISGSSVEVRVSASRTEIAQEQLREQERQRVLGIVPNFYVSYTPDAAPLNARQKFHLSLRSELDPVTLLGTAVSAGVGQAQNDPKGFGHGASGYAKRFGAAYADDFVGTMIGSALLASVFKQDPRYFYRGTGSVAGRALYAIANSVMCKSDSGRWEPNYSRIGGGLAGAGIAQLYYPPESRQDAATIFRNFAIAKGSGAVENLIQEFVIPKITWTVKLPKRSKRAAAD